MFETRFYSFSKKDNSTATPTGTGTIFNCILKEPSSIIDPTIILQFEAGAVPNYNYARIDAFGRWYHVKNWTALNAGRWAVDLKCDVLATYKSVIGNSTFLVERASADFDGYLTDTLYPATQDKQQTVLSYSPSTGVWGLLTLASSYEDGYFVLSVVNADSSSFGYYVMTYSEFMAFKNALYNDISWYDGGSIADGIKKSLANPYQYINSCIWFPCLPPTKGAKEEIKFGFWNSHVEAYRLADNAFIESIFGIHNSALPQHPQASTRGKYLNCNPYTKIQVLMNPWGSFEIDPSFIAKGYALKSSLRIDFVTGQGFLKIESAPETAGTIGLEKELLYASSCMFGVSVPVTQRTTDYSGFAGYGAGLVGALTGHPIAGVTAMLGGSIKSIIDQANPSVSSKGMAGSLASLTAPYNFYFTHYILTEEDNASEGRPLMKKKQISALSGFIKTAEADFSGAVGSVPEREELKSHLLNGFYYE